MSEEFMQATRSSIDVLVGANIRSRRLSLKMQREDVAAKLGVDTLTLRGMETGRVRITAAQLQILCDLLQTSPASIYRGTA